MNTKDRYEILKTCPLRTPAFVIDAATLANDAEQARRLVRDARTRLLFAMKSFSIVRGLQELAECVDGFATSSLFEIQLAHHVRHPEQTIHLTTPGLRSDELPMICELADYVSFNSIPQWVRFRKQAVDRVNCGLRINPQLSFVSDVRYDPSRHNSKLGVPLDRLQTLLDSTPGQLEGIRGIHFHNNCDSSNLASLLATVEALLESIDPLYDQIEWINLGGGYLFNSPLNTDALNKAKARLQARGDFQLFMEPGASLIRRAGCFVASVIDLFDSGNQRIAILDTSVNHMPEVFEYQFMPDVIGDAEDHEYFYLLAGSSCLAGDLFGEYAFEQSLEIGSRVIFPDMGAYSMVKANMFNGINLPTLYLLHDNAELEELKHFEFKDFLTLCAY
jgi:carboxynorspermidine decarboxylase